MFTFRTHAHVSSPLSFKDYTKGRVPDDSVVSIDLSVNDDEETSKRTSSREEGNDNKQEGSETEDELEADASSPSEDTQKNSSHAAS